MNLNELTKVELQNMVKNVTALANAKLKPIKKEGLANYNQSFIKKYNILLNQKANYNIATKSGYFRKGVTSYTKNGKKHYYTKDELIKRYEIMNEFVNNPYASVEYTKQHLEELSQKWGIQSQDSIKKMFDLYREYGYDNYKDSDGTLTAMSKLVSDAEMGGMDAGEYLESILMEIEDNISVDSESKTITEEDYIKELQSHAHILK